MKVSVDANILARAILGDDPRQSDLARRLLREASLIAISSACLCELVWVLNRGAKLSKEDVAAAIRALLNTGNVVMDRPAVEAGLAILEDGGDFADGVTAYESQWLGGEMFMSFDEQAVDLLCRRGVSASLPV